MYISDFLNKYQISHAFTCTGIIQFLLYHSIQETSIRKVCKLVHFTGGRTSIRKVCKFVHFTGGEKVSNFAHFYQESVQICSLYWWGELLSGKCANLFTLLVGELLSGKCANLFTLLVGRTSIRKVCKLVHFTGGRTSIRKVCKFVHFTGGRTSIRKVQTCSLYWWENFYQESVQICSLYWWGEGEQFCSLLSGKCANLFTLLVGRR